MRMTLIMLAGLAALAIPGAGMAQNNQVESVAEISEPEAQRAGEILREFAADYVRDPMAIDARFGVKLGQRWWKVAVDRQETASRRGRLTDHSFGPHGVDLSEGMPDSPTWYFEFASLDVLEKVASGEINAGTASSQSFGSDKVGLEIGYMEGFRSTPGEVADLYITMSHFFTRGVPQVTRFGRANALKTHGAQSVSLHRMKGFRISFFSIGATEVANEAPDLQRGQVPNLFAIFRGRGTLHTDGDPIALEPGVSVFVPQFVKHELVNDGTEPLEGIYVLYGDNADFAFGTSYPAFQQDLNDFYRTYQYRTSPAEEDSQRTSGD